MFALRRRRRAAQRRQVQLAQQLAVILLRGEQLREPAVLVGDLLDQRSVIVEIQRLAEVRRLGAFAVAALRTLWLIENLEDIAIPAAGPLPGIDKRLASISCGTETQECRSFSIWMTEMRACW